MNRITATVEPSTSLTTAEARTIAEAAAGINANPFNVFDSLDKVEAFLRAGLTNADNGLGDPSGWHVHRGGSHVALIRVAGPGPFGSPRVLLVTVLPEPVAQSCWYCDGPLVEGSCPACQLPPAELAAERASRGLVAAPQAAGATTAPAEASLPAIVVVPGDGLRDSWDTFTKSYQPVPDKARLDALVEAVTAERPTDLDALRAKVRKLFPRWVIEREPGYFTLAQSKRHLPALVFSQALTAAEAGIEPGDALNVWVNQGSREATVLATIGRRYLVEYTMPKGTTALQVFTVGIQGGQTVSYRTINGQWLKAIVDAGQDWLCHPQSSFNQSAADLLASRKAVR